jgi:4-carboxymuconolactone decarboxylase
MNEAVPDAEGLERFRAVMGRSFTRPLTGVRELTINYLFASVWARPHLSLRDRSLVTVAVLAAQGRTDQLRDHIRGARSRGMGLDEIVEVMVQVAHYAGWPAGAGGQVIAEAVYAEDPAPRDG